MEDAVPIAITYGYSRDHRADLKQWMMGLVTTHDSDIPLFLRPLDGNSSDKESISAIVTAVMAHLRETLPEEQEERLAVFDSGGYSEGNMKRYNEVKIRWISRVPETSTASKTVLSQEPEAWQALSDGSGRYAARIMDLPQGKERWVIVRTAAGEQAAKEQIERKVKKSQEQWEKRLWHLSKQEFTCENDAQQAWKQAVKGKPAFLVTTFTRDIISNQDVRKRRPHRYQPPGMWCSPSRLISKKSLHRS